MAADSELQVHRATYEKVIAAMDVIKRAKVDKVGLATDAR